MLLCHWKDGDTALWRNPTQRKLKASFAADLLKSNHGGSVRIALDCLRTNLLVADEQINWKDTMNMAFIGVQLDSPSGFSC